MDQEWDINLEQLFDLSLDTYLHPDKKKHAYDLWKSMIQGYMNNIIEKRINEEFDSRFKDLSEKYFEKLQANFSEILQTEFFNLKQQIQKKVDTLCKK